MAVILDSFIEDNKPLHLSLTSIFGIGYSKSKKICYQLGIQPKCNFSLLTRNQYKKLRKLLNSEITGKRLSRSINANITALKKKRCYRGTRHRNKLPVRGQRTHSNAKTQKRIRR